MHKILVTGANGFIGKSIVPILQSQGYDVHITSSTMETTEKIHNINLLHTSRIEYLIKGIKPDTLLHLAWVVRPKAYWTSEDNLSWVSSTIELFKQFYLNGGQRGVMAGTSAEYNWNQYTPYNEVTSIDRPHTIYGVCKLNCAEIINEYAMTNHQSFSWGRIFFAYGANENRERLIPTVIRSLKNNNIFTFRRSEISGDFIYIEDVALAFISLLKSNIQGAVNIGCGKSTPLTEVILKIAQKLDKVNLLNLSYQPKLEQMSADIERLLSTGWQPKYTLDQGIDKTLEWYNI